MLRSQNYLISTPASGSTKYFRLDRLRSHNTDIWGGGEGGGLPVYYLWSWRELAGKQAVLAPHRPPPDLPGRDPQWAAGGSGGYTRPGSGYQHARTPAEHQQLFIFKKLGWYRTHFQRDRSIYDKQTDKELNSEIKQISVGNMRCLNVPC